MMQSQRQGNRYLAGLVIVFAVAFFAVGTLGPARRSPFYLAIVPLPAVIAGLLGWRAWLSDDRRSTGYSAAGLLLLLLVLIFSHLLPRSSG